MVPASGSTCDAIAIVIPLLMAMVMNLLILICIIACYKSPKFNTIVILCRKVKRYTKSQDHSVTSEPFEVHSTTEVVTTTESNQTCEEGGLQRQSTVSHQNEAYGKLTGVQRQKTVSQQNEAYGVCTLNDIKIVTASTTQPDTGQEDQEYEYVRFQT